MKKKRGYFRALTSAKEMVIITGLMVFPRRASRYCIIENHDRERSVGGGVVLVTFVVL